MSRVYAPEIGRQGDQEGKRGAIQATCVCVCHCDCAPVVFTVVFLIKTVLDRLRHLGSDRSGERYDRKNEERNATVVFSSAEVPATNSIIRNGAGTRTVAY